MSIRSEQLVYNGWTKLFMAHVQLPDGAVADRIIEDHGLAAAVLPYDPHRRTALLVSLPRAPVIRSGEVDLLEAPAGLIEAEGAETAAKREVLEEVGARLRELEFVSEAWPMASVSTERVYLYLAEYGQADRISGGGGAAGEHENITVIEKPLAELWAMAQSGLLRDMKTLLLVHVLRARRPHLFD